MSNHFHLITTVSVFHLLVSNHFHLTTSVSVFPSLGVQSLPSHNISVGLPIYWCPITSISQHQCRSSHLLVSNHFHLTTSVSVFHLSSHLSVSNHFHLTTSVSVFPSIGVQSLPSHNNSVGLPSLGVQSLPSHNISVGLPISWCPITSISQHQCRSSHLLVSNHFHLITTVSVFHLLVSNHFHLTTSVSVFPSISVQSLPSHNNSVCLPIYWCPITSIS